MSTINFNVFIKSLSRNMVRPYIFCFGLRILSSVTQDWIILGFFSNQGWLYFYEGLLWVDFSALFTKKIKNGFFQLSFVEENPILFFHKWGVLPVKIRYRNDEEYGLNYDGYRRRFTISYRCRSEQYISPEGLVEKGLEFPANLGKRKSVMVPGDKHRVWVTEGKKPLGECLVYPFRRASPRMVTQPESLWLGISGSISEFGPMWVKFSIGRYPQSLVHTGSCYKGPGFLYIKDINIVLVNITELINDRRFVKTSVKQYMFLIFLPGPYTLIPIIKCEAGFICEAGFTCEAGLGIYELIFINAGFSIEVDGLDSSNFILGKRSEDFVLY